MEYIDCLFLYLKRLRFVIDIDSNLRMNKTTVKARNLKQMAQMINYLREHGLLDLTELQKKTADVTVKYHELSEKIKSAEARMKEISETKTHAKSIEIGVVQLFVVHRSEDIMPYWYSLGFDVFVVRYLFKVSSGNYFIGFGKNITRS